MAHISTIGASIFSDLWYNKTASTSLPADEAAWETLFATAGDISEVGDIREFPSVGTPANIVNVPVYGQSTSSQVQGQADAPQLDFTINLRTSTAYGTDGVGTLVQNGSLYEFRFSLVNASNGAADGVFVDSGDTVVEHSSWYFRAQVAALLVNPSLTDASTAVLTLAIDGDFAGPFTV